MAVLCNFCDGCFAAGSSHDCPGRGPTLLYGEAGPPAALARYIDGLPEPNSVPVEPTVRTMRQPATILAWFAESIWSEVRGLIVGGLPVMGEQEAWVMVKGDFGGATVDMQARFPLTASEDEVRERAARMIADMRVQSG